MTNFTQPPT